jgi:hypothetical protein
MAILVALAACNNKSSKEAESFAKGSFGFDLEFFRNYQEALVLENEDAMVLIAPSYQGRVMTSSANGLEGMSLGWINYALIESGENAPHFNNYGGEERFWLGPEGGQYSIYFPPDADFVFDNWQVPAPIDSDAYELVESSTTQAVFKKNIKLKNYSGFDFNLRVDRTVTLLSGDDVNKKTGIAIEDGISLVAYQSINTITNTGKVSWKKETGLLSVWILGQLISSPTNTVIVPFIEGPEEELGPIVNDEYFGKVPSDRLKVDKGIIYFKADGNQRGKIGLTHSRAKNYLGSYDSSQKLLTLVYYNKPEEHDGYVNSMWEIQDDPYGGDVINSYNDGPLDDGSQLGPFYELETSSKAASLDPGASLTHDCATIHLSGSEEQMDRIINKIFGIGIEDVKKALIK